MCCNNIGLSYMAKINLVCVFSELTLECWIELFVCASTQAIITADRGVKIRCFSFSLDHILSKANSEFSVDPVLKSSHRSGRSHQFDNGKWSNNHRILSELLCCVTRYQVDSCEYCSDKFVDTDRLCENSCVEYCGKSYDVQSPRYQGEKKQFAVPHCQSKKKWHL